MAYTYRQATKKLKKLGYREDKSRRNGSHRGWIKPGTKLCVTIPDKGGKDIATGTLHKIVKQLGIEWETFEKT